jgi:hypothetical protein
VVLLARVLLLRLAAERLELRAAGRALAAAEAVVVVAGTGAAEAGLEVVAGLSEAAAAGWAGGWLLPDAGAALEPEGVEEVAMAVVGGDERRRRRGIGIQKRLSRRAPRNR